MKPLTILCGCTAWFLLDLIGNPEDRFGHDTAEMTSYTTNVWQKI